MPTAQEGFDIFKFIASEGGITAALELLVIIGILWGGTITFKYFCATRSNEVLALIERNKEITANTIKAFDQATAILKENIASRESTAKTLTEILNAAEAIPSKIELILLRSSGRNSQ